MNFGNQVRTQLTSDHRKNYSLHSQSNIFNTDVVIKPNQKAQVNK